MSQSEPLPPMKVGQIWQCREQRYELLVKASSNYNGRPGFKCVLRDSYGGTMVQPDFNGGEWLVSARVAAAGTPEQCYVVFGYDREFAVNPTVLIYDPV